MTGDLFINGVDAATMGVSMGKGFLDAIGASLAFKADIENDSALEHGKRVVLSGFFEPRELTLSFVIIGATKNQFITFDRQFLTLLYGRKLTIKIKGDSNYYRLVYTGRSTSFGYSPTGTCCTRMGRFTEVNPGDRGERPKNPLFSV